MPSIGSTNTGIAAAVSASVAFITSISLLFWRRRHLERITSDASKTKCCVSIELNELEHFLHMTGEQPVSTLTWFRGDYAKTIQMLKSNVEKILQTNPWLTGRVYKKKMFGKLVLEYEELTSSNANLDTYFVVEDSADSPISRDTPMDKLGTICTRRGLVIRNGSHEPLFRVMIVPCHQHPDTHFALVVSLSHLVGDGATYYKLHHMLCDSNDNENSIVPLIAERIASSARQQQEALGKAEYGYLTSLGVFVNVAWGMLRVTVLGPPPQEHFRFVDNDKMKLLKQQQAATKEVPFVSTNDVLTSWFLQDTGCTHGVMNVNFRNRLEGHSDVHAGNYEGFLFYRREDSATPKLIRQSLSNFRRVSEHKNDDCMPGFYESVTSSIALVTNWTSFSQPISSLKNCQEELHVPIYDVASATPYSYALLIIFRADSNKIGLYYSGQEHLVQKLHSAPFLQSQI